MAGGPALAAGVVLLHLLEYGDGLGGKAVAGVLVGQRLEDGIGVLRLAREREHVRELQPQPVVRLARLELALQEISIAFP